jgi:tetraacyldisaccharide 4'-kinase
MPRGQAPAFWYGAQPVPRWARALVPLYRLLRLMDRVRYALGLRRIQHLPVPVIVIGNLNVGGSGKTPLTLALIEALRAAGRHPGVVSRGYGGTQRAPHLLAAADTAARVGDEPLLLHRRGQVPVAVGARRAAAARLLLPLGVDVILSDDGLQHRALGRDIEICVIDGVRRFGNGRLLPEGPLREPPTRLAGVDFVVCNGGVAQPGEVPMSLQPGMPCALAAGAATPQPGAEVHAIAGIGDPARFFATLRALGYRVREHAFADHHTYVPADFAFDDGTVPLLMTEKDAVKCATFARPHWWALPVRAQLSPEFTAALLARLAAVTAPSLPGISLPR